MKKLILILTTLCYSNQVFANKLPLYFAPLTNSKDQKAFVRVHDDQFETFSKNFLENTPNKKIADELLSTFEQAQKYYLIKSMDLAKQYYQLVANLQDHDEWKDIHRKMIFLSLVRLSELDQLHQEEWLNRAISFSPDIDFSDFNFSSDQKNKLKELKKQINKNALSWSVQSLQKDFSYILLNGHVIDLKKYDNIRIPSGSYRITYLSDIYKPQTYQITSQQIPFVEPSRIPFVSGDCEHPVFNQEGLNIDQLAIYYSDDCVQYFLNNKWSKNEKSNLIPEKESLDFAHEILATQVDEKPFYKKTWFWVLSASVAAGLIVYATQKKNSEPSHDVIRY